MKVEEFHLDNAFSTAKEEIIDLDDITKEDIRNIKVRLEHLLDSLSEAIDE